MRVKDLIELLQKLPEEWDIDIAVPDNGNLIDEYSLQHIEDAGDLVYLDSEESGMLDALIFDPCQLMKFSGVDLDDWLRDNKKPIVDFRDTGKDYRGVG